jgi:DNA-binding NtrC family response regulator
MHQFSEELKEHSLKGKKIILAEDEGRLRTIVTMMLEELEAEVITVENGQAAIDAYQENPGVIDVTILDMRMAGLSGEMTYRRLLEIDANIKVLLCSGILPDDSLLALLKENTGGFLEKPFNLAQLSTVIVKILDGESVILTL